MRDNTLAVKTGANQITWSYGLNTQTYPTYGGEVVQVLSAYIDNMTIMGDVYSYGDLEALYGWFMEYIENATQGEGMGKVGTARFNQSPVTMVYPERGWRFAIKPISLPGFKIGRDVVVPSWQIEAVVIDPDPNAVSLTTQRVIEEGNAFTKLHAGIGYVEENPFSDPMWANKKKDDTKPEEGEDEQSEDSFDPAEGVRKVADWFNNVVDSYIDHDFEAAGVSGPADPEADPESDEAPDAEEGDEVAEEVRDKLRAAFGD